MTAHSISTHPSSVNSLFFKIVFGGKLNTARASLLDCVMATAAASIFQNFEELQRELQAFNELFSLWTEQRRRALMDDKEAYLKTLSEEQGILSRLPSLSFML